MSNKKNSVSKQEEILLGIDYGGVNTGLAFGRSGLGVPLKVIRTKDENVTISEISRVVLENKVTKLVIGLPITYEGKETEQAVKTRRFAKLLKIRLKRPVEFVNEYDSSNEANFLAIESGASQKANTRNDHISAALILKRYYNEKDEPVTTS